MPTATTTGMMLVALGVFGLGVASLTTPAIETDVPVKRYTLALAEPARMTLIEVKRRDRHKHAVPERSASGLPTLMCRRVFQVAGLEIGARCIATANTNMSR